MPDLYYSPLCAESRACLLLLKAINLDCNLITVNKQSNEHTTPQFTRISPQQIIPVLKDNDFDLCESRAINTYLALQHSDDDTLYPESIEERAIINRLLFFDMGTLHKRLLEYVNPIMNGELYKPDLNKIKDIKEALNFLDYALEGQKFAAGENITIADHSLIATVSTIQEIGIDMSGYSNIIIWAARCAALMPGYDEVNNTGAKQFGAFFKSKLNKE